MFSQHFSDEHGRDLTEANHVAPTQRPEEDVANMLSSADLFCDADAIQEYNSDEHEDAHHQDEFNEPHQPASPEEARKMPPPPNYAVNKHLAMKAIKTTKRSRQDDDWEQPDLAEYFNDFDTSNAMRIRICRTYASYLDAQTPKKKIVKKKTNKK